jgi:hypothetical protein
MWCSTPSSSTQPSPIASLNPKIGPRIDPSASMANIVFGILLLDSIFRIGIIEFLVVIVAISLAAEPGFSCIMLGLILGGLHALDFFAWCRKTAWIQPISLLILGTALLFGVGAQRQYWIEGADILPFMKSSSKFLMRAIAESW